MRSVVRRNDDGDGSLRCTDPLHRRSIELTVSTVLLQVSPQENNLRVLSAGEDVSSMTRRGEDDGGIAASFAFTMPQLSEAVADRVDRSLRQIGSKHHPVSQ